MVKTCNKKIVSTGIKYNNKKELFELVSLRKRGLLADAAFPALSPSLSRESVRVLFKVSKRKEKMTVEINTLSVVARMSMLFYQVDERMVL
jgi:hypothetical protein